MKLPSPLLLSSAILALMTLGCGGSNDDSKLNQITNPSPPSSSGGGDVQASKLGYGSGSEFLQGAIHVAGVSAGGALSSGGTTRLTVNLVDATNTLVTQPITVTFNSTCFASGEVVLSDDTGATTNKITTNIGEASIVYKDNGCAKTDAITATAVVNNQISVAKTSLSVERDTVQAIAYVENPNAEYISLKGTGGTETAQVKFKVTGITGIPVKDVPIDLELNTDLGGLCLANSAAATCEKTAKAVSDKNGIVSVIVRAGTIATPVRITATDTNANVFTLSSQLTVSTGIPDQDSFGLAADHANPEGWEYNNKEVKFTVSLGDAFNNPPPAGTAVTFWTDGGRIEPSCNTDKNGNCTVSWWSGSPRNEDDLQRRAELVGKAVILAFAQGNESFEDKDGDGFYTPGEWFDDIGEAWIGSREGSMVPFVDFNQDKQYTGPNGVYNGVLCRDSDAQQGLCTKNSLNVFKRYIIALSSVHAGSITLSGTGSTRTLIISDLNGNSMPYETKVFVVDSAGYVIGATSGPTTSKNTDFDATTVTAVVPSQTGPNHFSINFLFPGSYTVVVTAPDGTKTTQSINI